MTERLWALARAEAFNKHAHYSLEADKQGHVQGMNDAEWGFSTCPHPDCVLVRAALSRQAEPSRRQCACWIADPVMQADRRFYCHRCSFQIPAVICDHCQQQIVQLSGRSDPATGGQEEGQP